MSKSRYKFFDEVWNDDINHLQKGFLRTDIVELFETDNDIIYQIPLEYEFRPDLIARKFFGNPRLDFILTYINRIEDAPEGYYAGRSIRIPRFERVIELI